MNTMPFHSDGPKKLAVLLLLAIALPLLDGVALSSTSGEEALPAIFDGKSLDGWEGDQKHWRVENGVSNVKETNFTNIAFLQSYTMPSFSE